MTRILVQRGSGSSSNQNRSTVVPAHQLIGTQSVKEEEEEVVVEDVGNKSVGASDDVVVVVESSGSGINESLEVVCDECVVEEGVDEEKMDLGNSEAIDAAVVIKELGGLRIEENVDVEKEGGNVGLMKIEAGSSCPPPPPVPPPKPLGANASSMRSGNGVRVGSSGRAVAWPVVCTRNASSGSRPSSPRSYGEGDGYNSSDEQNPCFGSSYNDAEKERQFELDIRRAKGLEIKRMIADGNCLFRAVADQVYGDTEAYDLTRQMCIDYMERESDHFSHFITEGFTSYCKRKRRDKVYGNNAEIQALSEMYNRPIHIYSYKTEPINIFHGSYNTDTPPIRLSYHRGNHYNSLVDPRRLAIGAGLGFSSLQGANIDRDRVKAAIRAQQEQQIDNALLAEGRFYSDLELTEKEIERMVMEASRAEYLAGDKFKPQLGFRETSTSSAEPSSSGARPSEEESKMQGNVEQSVQSHTALSSSMQMLLSMGFSYLQAIEAHSLFGEDLDSMVCYLVETGDGSSAQGSIKRSKGKATKD